MCKFARAIKKLSFGCLAMVEQLFLAMLWGCRQFVIVVFSDHNHLLILKSMRQLYFYEESIYEILKLFLKF